VEVTTSLLLLLLMKMLRPFLLPYTTAASQLCSLFGQSWIAFAYAYLY
jgi:hypothetical protein